MFNKETLAELTPEQRDFLIPALKSGCFEALADKALEDVRERIIQIDPRVQPDELQEQFRYLKTCEANLLQFREFISTFKLNRIGE